jgi:hypothetical protein
MPFELGPSSLGLSRFKCLRASLVKPLPLLGRGLLLCHGVLPSPFLRPVLVGSSSVRFYAEFRGKPTRLRSGRFCAGFWWEVAARTALLLDKG